jgi:hypothetical protein
MDDQETLAMFVAGGTMRDADPTQKMPPEKLAAIKARLEALREGEDLPAPTAAPSDFRAAIEDKEQKVAAQEAAARGKDVPRWKEDAPVMKPVYHAVDTVTGLPAPGGLGVIILIIAIFFLILIPASTAGETRMLLLWEVLLGRKEIQQTQPNYVDAGTGAVNPIGAALSTVGTGIAAGVGIATNTSTSTVQTVAQGIAAGAGMAFGFGDSTNETSIPTAGGIGYE